MQLKLINFYNFM